MRHIRLGRVSTTAIAVATSATLVAADETSEIDFDFARGDLSRAGRVGDPDFATDGDFETSIRVSRFGIRSNTETDIGPIRAVLEFDLFIEDDATTSADLWLRKAFVNINDSFLLGQENSNFVPIVHYPRAADFNGPVGITFARVPQARYTFSNENLTLAAEYIDIESEGPGGFEEDANRIGLSATFRF